MDIDLDADVAGSYAAYGMVQVLKDIFVEVFDLADSTSHLTGSATHRPLCVRYIPHIEGIRIKP